MRFKMHLASVLASVFAFTAIPAFSQVAPAATQGDLPLVVGAGFSDYNIDWGLGRREDGGTIYADWTILQMPRILQGLGLEVEGRDLTVNAPASLSFFQYETAGGGPIYHFLRPRNIHPYAKAFGGFGRIKFASGLPLGSYHTDTRSYWAIGGGADFHAWRHVWVRADYEYQIWQSLFGGTGALTPNGFTIGPEYDFGTPRER